MPLVRPCERRGCGAYALDGSRWCRDHAESEDGARADRRRAQDRQRAASPSRDAFLARRRVYRDRRWPVARREALLRDGYVCQHCGAEDDLTVDHILGITGTDDDFDPAYLVTLCRSCHGRKDGGRSSASRSR